jgi:UDP-N-acetylglucosamine:LPS N-acetylglucosamine transferase
VESIALILQDEDRRRRMAASARSLHVPSAAQRLSEIVLTLAGIDPVARTPVH